MEPILAGTRQLTLQRSCSCVHREFDLGHINRNMDSVCTLYCYTYCSSFVRDHGAQFGWYVCSTGRLYDLNVYVDHREVDFGHTKRNKYNVSS